MGLLPLLYALLNMRRSSGQSDSWTSLPQAMSQSVDSLNKRLDVDKQWQAFVDTKAIIEPVTMGIISSSIDDTILVNVSPGAKTGVSTGASSRADFVLSAKPEQWKNFFDKDPVAPYTSFVGLQVRNHISFRHRPCPVLKLHLSLRG